MDIVNSIPRMRPKKDEVFWSLAKLEPFQPFLIVDKLYLSMSIHFAIDILEVHRKYPHAAVVNEREKLKKENRKIPEKTT